VIKNHKKESSTAFSSFAVIETVSSRIKTLTSSPGPKVPFLKLAVHIFQVLSLQFLHTPLDLVFIVGESNVLTK